MLSTFAHLKSSETAQFLRRLELCSIEVSNSLVHRDTRSVEIYVEVPGYL